MGIQAQLSATLEEGVVMLLWEEDGAVSMFQLKEVVDFGGDFQSTAVYRGPYNYVMLESSSLMPWFGVQ